MNCWIPLPAGLFLPYSIYYSRYGKPVFPVPACRKAAMLLLSGVFLWQLTVLSIEDIRRRKLHRSRLLCLMAAGLLRTVLTGGFEKASTGLLAALLITGSVSFASRGKLGRGDVILAAAFGIWSGPADLLYGLMAGLVSAGFWYAARNAADLYRRNVRRRIGMMPPQGSASVPGGSERMARQNTAFSRKPLPLAAFFSAGFFTVRGIRIFFLLTGG